MFEEEESTHLLQHLATLRVPPSKKQSKLDIADFKTRSASHGINSQ